MGYVKDLRREIVIYPGRKLRHFFDLGVFICYRNNGDGTCSVYKEDLESTNPIRIECRLKHYDISEMQLA